MAKYISGRSKLTPQTGLSSDRYRYLSVSESEPNLGDPIIGPSAYLDKFYLQEINILLLVLMDIQEKDIGFQIREVLFLVVLLFLMKEIRLGD